MNGVIVIYGTPDDPENDVARDALGKLTGVTLREVICPRSASDLYRLPFVKDENGGRHFGVPEIERFVHGRLSAQSAM